MKMITLSLFKKICLTLATAWSMVFTIAVVVSSEFRDMLKIDSYWDAISFSYFIFAPLIFVYLILYFFLPYIMEIHESNLGERKKDKESFI